jgi:cysteine-rich repeat protein
MACGDGTVGPGEACDDGNVADGDCCSSTCTLVADGTTCNDGNACTLTDTCHAGICGSTTTRDCGTCATCDAAQGCVARVFAACHQPTKTVSGQLEIVDARTSKLAWKWTEGEALDLRVQRHDRTVSTRSS